jgi:hypothetical protein
MLSLRVNKFKHILSVAPAEAKSESKQYRATTKGGESDFLLVVNFPLTVHVQNKARFLGLYELRVQSLTGKYGVEIRPLNGRPQ